MSAVFNYTPQPKAFDGIVLLAVDGGATVWAFPNASCSLSDSDNISRPSLIDSSEIAHIEVPGLRMGSLSFACPLMPDRAVDSFLNAAHGPRTNQTLTPFVYNIIPYGGGGIIKGTGVWFGRTTISGSFGVGGAQAMNVMRCSAMVMDVDNVLGAPTLAAPAVVGKNGLGASSFDNSSFTNSGATTYDKIRSYSMTVDNSLSVIPGISDPVNRIGAGCQVGDLRGAFTLEQLESPTNAVPGVRGQYPFTLALPTGDRSHKLSLDLSTSRDGSNLSLVPTDFIGRGQLYSIFGTNAGNTTGTAGMPWLFQAVYI